MTQLEEQLRDYRRAGVLSRWHPSCWRGAWWAWRAVRRARRDLAAQGLSARALAPPAVPAGARRGVDAVLRRVSPTCLERCLVLQRWLLAHGVVSDVVIGVAKKDGAVVAHAWLAFEEDDPHVQQFQEIQRVAAR